MMYSDEIRNYAISKEDVEECFPFDEDTLVFKVNGKIFMLMSLTPSPPQINLKCDPEKAILLREEYPEGVFPGYHMSKKHWNTVWVGKVPGRRVKEWIDDSYALVRRKRH